MATNVNFTYPNFTLSAQAGTFGSINTSEATTILRIKNASGGLITDYTLSANIQQDHEIIAVEYCGPVNLSEMIDDVTFITVERVNSSQCIVKRWETNVGFSILDLKQQTLYYTSGVHYYNIRAAAVEHYYRSFDFAQPSGQNYIDINNSSRIESGDTLFLGPSTDTDNPDATEKVTVSYVDGNRVYLNSGTIYQYVFGDPITFFNNIYLVSQTGYAGDTSEGAIFKHDIYSGSRLESTNAGEYKRITGARWSTEADAVAAISNHQLLFIRPYNSYLKWKSMFLNNVTANDYNYFTTEDVVFDEETLYKLAKKATTKDDDGNKSTESWTNYNYQQDTLLPYTHNVSIYTKQQRMIGVDTITIYAQTRDQFGVGLRDVNINFYDDNADAGADFEPLNGQDITDKDGYASVEFNTSGSYTGLIGIDIRADKSSSFTGSEYCWNSLILDSQTEYNTSFGRGAMFQVKQLSSDLGMRQISDPYKINVEYRYNGSPSGGEKLQVPPLYIDCRSYFGTPGGNWVYGGDYEQECWPWFQITGGRKDGPIEGQSCYWDCISWPATDSDPAEAGQCTQDGYPRPNFITQVTSFTQQGVPPDYYLKDPLEEALPNDSKPLILPQVLWYWQYYKEMNCSASKCELEEGEPVPYKLFQIDDADHWMRLSQLNLSKHSHWVDGNYSEYLTTEVALDQFIFVEDADPAFWSEKNPRETDIWIRMRPFAFSLDGDTLKFFIREVYTVNDVTYDTGYYDVIEKYGWPPNNDQITIEYFDAGGGALGIEFTYDNPDIYHHNGIVFVHIEVYDTAAEPNYIYTDYWFKIIPDYKSPYLENENPDREEDQVPLDTQLYFEIKDDGEGVDIDTLEVYLNSRIVYHAGMTHNPGTVIEEVNLNHYKVMIDLPYDLQYNKAYSVGVVVDDISDSKNKLRDSYRFYTQHSEVPWFTDFDPKLCKRGMPRFRDVSFIVLGAGNGVDEETIRLQVHDKDVTDKSKITPIIYRVS